MPNITVNFSSQWTSIQVAKVIASPTTAGEPASYPYSRKIPHGLGYPPLAIGMAPPNGKASYNIMEGVDVDATYVYIEDDSGSGGVAFDCVVVYALDISKDFDFSQYTSEVDDVQQDTHGNLDLRKFLLHSRAVSPMLLAVDVKDYTLSDMGHTYTSPLNYPTFQFGYVRWVDPGSGRVGIWQSAPLASQAYPWLRSDGYTSVLGGTTIAGVLATDKGSIITLRNPAIISENKVVVTI